jgi:hypothetical protein
MNAVNDLLISLGEDIKLKKVCLENIFNAGNRKWLANILPYELLSKSLKECVEILTTLDYSNHSYETFPDNVKSPNYGDKWGRIANYIEINNRAISEMDGNRCKNGLISAMKILPALPPSAKSWANCVILSQIFPNIYGDGFNKLPEEENSIYGIKLGIGYSTNIINSEISDEVQFRAFNDLAHFHGLKTGFRTVISADQIKFSENYKDDVVFDWKNPQHQELFIEEHVKLINMGFEAIFIDSAKHIGGYDMANYAGVGALPEYAQMQYILNEIRQRSGCTSISFIGEKSTEDFDRYENMGLTTGTAFIEPDNYDVVKKHSYDLKYRKNYAPGVEVSNDNDEGGRSYEERLKRINTVLFGYEYPSDKLASFMQMEDMFPLRYDTNTHHLMMSNPSYSEDGSSLSHWQNLFAHEDGRMYNKKVGELFSHALDL